jgi:hypothetical protein
VTQRRGGRPTGPERVPFTTKIRPEALAILRRRSLAVHRTARAINRVIEEDVMGLAAMRLSETEDVDLTIERDAWTDEATVTVRLYPGSGDAEVEAVAWEDEERGALTEEERERAIAAAWRKREEA